MLDPIVSKRIDRRGFLQGATSATLGSIAVAGCLGNETETRELSVAGLVGEEHYMTTESIEVFKEEVEERTDEVEIEIFMGQQLGEATEMLQLAKDGTADIAQAAPAYLADELPLSNVGNLPNTFDNAAHGTSAYWKLVEDHLTEVELNDHDVVPIYVHTEYPYQVINEEPQLIDIGDWEGMNIRSPGGIGSLVIDQLGGNPVEVTAPEIYQSWERGTLDGTIGTQPSIYPMELYDFGDYMTRNVNLGSFCQLWVMNSDTWEGLSQDAQSDLSEAGRDVMQHYGSFLDERIEELNDQIADKGVNVYDVPENHQTEWNEQLNAVAKMWAEREDDAGRPGTETLDAFIAQV